MLCADYEDYIRVQEQVSQTYMVRSLPCNRYGIRINSTYFGFDDCELLRKLLFFAPQTSDICSCYLSLTACVCFNHLLFL